MNGFIFSWDRIDWPEIWQAAQDTLTMLTVSTLFTVLIGLPLGIVLYLASRNALTHNSLDRAIYFILSLIINVLRSVPFIILMIMLFPLTKVIVGKTIGVEGSIPPLIIAAAPFFARLVDTSLREVDRGVVEAAQSMGASPWQIIWKVLLPESRPGLIAGITITAVTLVSYTAMSGVIGGGGLGDLALRYGYQRFQTEVMIVTVFLLVVLVQLLQMAGDWLVKRFVRK